jgi:hypothetical protein
MKIQITQEDIDNGEIMDTNQCPIARAFKRLGYTEVQVEAKRIYPYGYFFSIYIVMPEKGKDFVLDYDERSPVEPFEMEVEIP